MKATFVFETINSVVPGMYSHDVTSMAREGDSQGEWIEAEGTGGEGISEREAVVVGRRSDRNINHGSPYCFLGAVVGKGALVP